VKLSRSFKQIMLIFSCKFHWTSFSVDSCWNIANMHFSFEPLKDWPNGHKNQNIWKLAMNIGSQISTSLKGFFPGPPSSNFCKIYIEEQKEWFKYDWRSNRFIFLLSKITHKDQIHFDFQKHFFVWIIQNVLLSINPHKST
jgi:hypothetical protein